MRIKRKTAKMKKISERKYMVPLLIIMVIVLVGLIGYIGWNYWENYRDDVIDKQKEQMMLISETLAGNMEENLLGYSRDLKYMCQFLEFEHSGVSDSEWRDRIVTTYLKNNTLYVKDVICTDRIGAILFKDSDYEEEKIFDIFDCGDDSKMMITQAKDGNIYFAFERKMTNGISIKMLVDTKEYYRKMISGIRLGTNGYVVLKNSRGVIYMHPREEQLGKTAIEGRKELYGELDLESLEELIKNQTENESGIAEYYSYWWTNEDLPRTKKISAFHNVKCGNGFIIISTVMDYDDIYKPLMAGFWSIFYSFIGILSILIIFAVIIIVQILKGQKTRKEIEYLRDLNQVLEETKRGEEVIAHQQRLQIMGTMTGGIAHEFNNLLTPIMGYSEMLLMSLPNDSEEADFAREIFEASDKAKDIIKQIAGLSRKNMETVFTFIPIKKAIRRSVKMVRSVCPINISIHEEIAFEQEGYLGNETQLNQVILNICVNAFHAIGKEKEGIVSIYGEAVSREEIEKRHDAEIGEILNDFLCLKITDNGCGIEPDLIKCIFDPFFTTKVGGAGTGLGLSVAEQIVHSHNGYIFVKSEVGVGTEFYIYFPKANQTDVDMTIKKSSEDDSMRILAIDDNGKVLRLLERRFNKLGIAISSVNNTKEAKEKLSNEKFDVILIDQEISRTGKGDSGILFATSINAMYPDMIKIIMADQVKKDIIEAKQHGFIDAYVEKPVSDARILEEIHKVLG
ncbi:MAG: response regulator [Lachnospiraceae bacterium]|nr:response regulator [Lachnospiraceae bacterium]